MSITTGTWTLDAAHSDVDFVVRHAGISKVRGTFQAVEGELTVAEDFTASTVNVTVDVSSVDTKNEQRDGHLRSEEFFDVANHPTMTFRSTAFRGDLESFVLVGELTLRGVTRTVELDAEFGGQAVDAFGVTRVGFEAKGEISRKDFGLTWNAALEAGGVLVSDTVKLELSAAFTLPQEG
ncbi:MAG: YceI family protein [Micrococcus sp.]|nr:YceI family protein [Micrococcus sp.]